jgi:hypothetical protein
MVQVLVGLQGNSSRSPSSSFLAWVPGEYARHSPHRRGKNGEEGDGRGGLSWIYNVVLGRSLREPWEEEEATGSGHHALCYCCDPPPPWHHHDPPSRHQVSAPSLCSSSAMAGERRGCAAILWGRQPREWERERRGGDRESEELSAVGWNDPRGREEEGG